MIEKDIARFLSKFDAKSDGCWLWNGAVNERGYGLFSLAGKMVRAHRFSYELFSNLIPEGLEIDHLCHDPAACKLSECPHRRCVNPRHLAVVSHIENAGSNRSRARENGANNREKTHCPKGHEYTPENTYQYGNRRVCRICTRERVYEQRALHGR